MSVHVAVQLPHILSCLPLRTFWLYYPPIPFLQQVIAVLRGERCLTQWNVSHVKTDRIMFESSLIEVLTADVEDFVSTLCLTASLKCPRIVKPSGEDEALSDVSRVIYFSSWTVVALFSTVLILDKEFWFENNPLYPYFQTLVQLIHMGGFISRSHKEGANIKANHIVLITGLQPAPLFHGFPGISIFGWS